MLRMKEREAELMIVYFFFVKVFLYRYGHRGYKQRLLTDAGKASCVCISISIILMYSENVINDKTLIPGTSEVRFPII